MAKKGFTLIEVVVVSLVMVGFFTGVYKIYQSVSRTQAVGQWMLNTTTELRNGLNMLRDEISQASKPRKITQMGAEDLTGGAWDSWRDLKCPTGSSAAGGKTYTNFGANATLISVYSCIPGREGIPGVADIATVVTEVVLKIENKQIVFEKRKVVPMGVVTRKKVICANPLAMTIRLIPIPAGTTLSVKNRNSLEIEITSRHPRYTTTSVTESINAPFEVEGREG